MTIFTSKMVYDSIVIGKGLIGTAAAKYLSQSNQKVAIIGPSEPEDYDRATIFASHYDQARIQSIIGKDAYWTNRNWASAQQYKELQAKTGINFHSPVGCLYVNPTKNGDYFAQADDSIRDLKLNQQRIYQGAELKAAFPYFQFSARAKALYESNPAGLINPRLLVKAQLKAFRQQGGTIHPYTVAKVIPGHHEVTVETSSGLTFRANKVLLATGAFTNFNDLITNKLPLHLKSETVLLLEVDDNQLDRYKNMPGLLYAIDQPDYDDVYLLPPVKYPDGKYYLKIGANLRDEASFTTQPEVVNWFRAGDSDRHINTLKKALYEFMPDFAIQNYHSGRCIVTYSESGYPILEPAVSNQLFLAVAANGYGAMCSDALGREAAQMVDS